MAIPLTIGVLVTVLPPFDGDPIIVELQPHGRIAAVRSKGDSITYVLELLDAFPHDHQYGPFPAHRIVEVTHGFDCDR